MDANTVLAGEPVVLKRALAAKWLGNGAYSDNVQLYGSANVTITLNTIGDQRTGDGAQVLASYRRITGATISLQWAGDLTTLGLMLGITPSSSGVTPARLRAFRMANRGTPYFGLAGAVDLDNGNVESSHFFAPKCQLNADTIEIFNMNGSAEAAFPTVTVECNVLPDAYYIQGAANELQNLALGTPTLGTYTLSIGNSTTTALAYNATAAAIQAALVALPVIGTGNATVTVNGAGFNILFSGRLANSKFPLMVGLGAGGFNGVIAITRLTAGASGDTLIVGLYEVEGQYAPALPPLYIA